MSDFRFKNGKGSIISLLRQYENVSKISQDDHRLRRKKTFPRTDGAKKEGVRSPISSLGSCSSNGGHMNTVAVLAFSIGKRAQLLAIRITELPILLTEGKINRPGYKFSKYFQNKRAIKSLSRPRPGPYVFYLYSR